MRILRIGVRGSAKRKGFGCVVQQVSYVGHPEAPVAPRSANAGKFACGCPSGDRLGIDLEHLGDLTRREQVLGLHIPTVTSTGRQVLHRAHHETGVLLIVRLPMHSIWQLTHHSRRLPVNHWKIVPRTNITCSPC